MNNSKCHPWGDDPLSTFFLHAEQNEYATSINFPAIYSLLQRLHSTHQKIEETLEQDNRQELLLSRFLIVRVRSSILAAIRLTFSGQAPESYAVLRLGIEQAWYALYIAKDPAPPTRGKIWLCRNDDEAAKSSCKEEFTVGNVRRLHESLDLNTAKQLHGLYETIIDLGAHPNQQGVLTSLSSVEFEKQLNYKVGILSLEPLLLVSTLRMTVAVAVGTLKVFQLIFPKRFELMGIDHEIESIIVDLNTVFKSVLPEENV